jgi:hypothetical protein
VSKDENDSPEVRALKRKIKALKPADMSKFRILMI